MLFLARWLSPTATPSLIEVSKTEENWPTTGRIVLVSTVFGFNWVTRAPAIWRFGLILRFIESIVFYIEKFTNYHINFRLMYKFFYKKNFMNWNFGGWHLFLLGALKPIQSFKLLPRRSKKHFHEMSVVFLEKKASFQEEILDVSQRQQAINWLRHALEISSRQHFSSFSCFGVIYCVSVRLGQR